jgi:serine/threonine protein kinase
VKIIDFGFAEVINREKLLSGQGTAGYIAPEIFRQAPFTEKSDVFSLGIIMYSLVSG